MNQSQLRTDTLSRHINQEHLDAEALLKLISCFNDSPIGMLQLDNFLIPKVAEHCNQFLTDGAGYGALYGYTHKKKSTTDKTEWLAVPESERFFCYEMLDTNRGKGLSVNAISFLKLRHFFESDAFKFYIETLTARNLGPVTPIRVHRMRTGHFLKRHSDRGRNRDIAFILYLSRNWMADYGGDLQIIDRDGENTTLSPAYNKLLIFDVHQHKHHYISEITEQATALKGGRISINGWFQKSNPLNETT